MAHKILTEGSKTVVACSNHYSESFENLTEPCINHSC